ncbi:hypothetical protein glysoja_037349 [Glycine soja]|uniref:Uncharacterized protein n=1 Tax=Glycine soja TaxID=3848 RepID=A0A0B2QKP7_GLYSO|nr:hypothetical protein glysoja_037349 [Glycine soja]
MKGKIVALELLKILLENAGAVFRTSERFTPYRNFTKKLKLIGVIYNKG